MNPLEAQNKNEIKPRRTQRKKLNICLNDFFVNFVPFVVKQI